MSELDWGLVVTQLRRELGLGRGRFGRIFSVADKTVMRWERGGTKPQHQARREITYVAYLMRAYNDGRDEQMKAVFQHLFDLWCVVLGTMKHGTMSALARRVARARMSSGSEPIIQVHLPECDSTPKAWYDLRTRTAEGQFQTVVDFGPSVLAGLEAQLGLLEQSAMMNWIGVSSQRCGHYEEAEVWYDRAYHRCPFKPYRQTIRANQGTLHTKRHDFQRAFEAFDAVLSEDPSHYVALFSAVCAASMKRDEVVFRQRAERLSDGLSSNVAVAEARLQLKNDPEMRWAIERGLFGEMFPEEAVAAAAISSARTSRALVSIVGGMLIAFTLLAPAVSWASANGI